MRHSRFLGALLVVLALLSFVGSQAVLAAYPTSEFSMSQSQGARGVEGAFQLAVMGGSTAPSAMPTEKPVEVAPVVIPQEKSVEKVEPEKPAVKTKKVSPKMAPKPRKVSNPRKKKVKKADAKKASDKKPKKEEDGFITKTFKQLIGNDKKEVDSKSQIQKTAGKETSEKKEGGFLTRALKSLVGGDDKEEKTAKKNSLNPLNTAPDSSSAAQKKEDERPKTAKSEAKKNLKDSFEKLTGVGAVKDKSDSESAKTGQSTEETKSANKKESGGLLDGILGGGDKKKDTSVTKQAEVKDTVKQTSAPAKPRKLAAKKYVAEEDEGAQEEVGDNYGGAKKGKNLLKESFKTLVTDK